MHAINIKIGKKYIKGKSDILEWTAFLIIKTKLWTMTKRASPVVFL